MKYRQNDTSDVELVIGLVCPMGTNRKLIKDNIADIATKYNYNVINIKVSDIIRASTNILQDYSCEYDRIIAFMNAGDKLRAEDRSILAKKAAVEIHDRRKKSTSKRNLYIIDSLKHECEVHELRDIYGHGFFLFAIHSSDESKIQYLENHLNITDPEKRSNLITRDERGSDSYAQNTSEAFHLADFFLTENGNNLKVYNSLQRFIDIIFGDPFRTPTFHEFAMFTAHTSAMRSSDLSRQVGAVITKGTDIISIGANECPKAGGGSYWPLFDDQKNLIYDVPKGRDYTREHDYNSKVKFELINNLLDGLLLEMEDFRKGKKITKKLTGQFAEIVLKKLNSNIETSGLHDLTEYGRVVHAEMDAILTCARKGVSCNKGVLFSTTFPCHNCAKHIVASGINSVVYIEPYPKSKALEMHEDSITNSDIPEAGKVSFVPFVGVGPRQFINLFSMNLSYGEKIRRKKKGSSEKVEFDKSTALPRIRMFDQKHTEIEQYLASSLSG